MIKIFKIKKNFKNSPWKRQCHLRSVLNKGPNLFKMLIAKSLT